MLIFRYLTAEVLKSQLAVFLILMIIFVSQKFVVFLGDASEGGIPGKLVLSFVLLKLPQLASLILPLSLFLGIILAYSRVYADSDMTVLKACGISEWYIVRVTLISSVFMALVAAVLTLYLAPLASEKEAELKQQIDADTGLASLRSGRFQHTSNGKAVVFIHDIDNGEQTKLQKVFVAQLSQSETSAKVRLAYAKTGTVSEQKNGDQQLALISGKRYEFDKHQAKAQRITEFSDYKIIIEEQAIEQQRRKLEAVPTIELTKRSDSEAVAQFQWRLAIPLAIPILTLIAVPLSAVNPRQGKFAKLVPAIVLYLGYFILLNAAKFAVEDGKVPHHIGLWWIHFTAFFIGIWLILKERPLGGVVRGMLKGRSAGVSV